MKNTNKLRTLESRHAGEKVVIVANGPSLNKMDLSFLKSECVIGLNKIFLGFRKFHFYPRYYVAVNPKVIQQSCEEIQSLNCVKFIDKNAGEKLIQEDALTYFINTSSPLLEFCEDITQVMHQGWTVTFVALQIAYYLGFKEVVMIGLDHRFQFQGGPNESKVMEGPDINHFSDQYFGYGQQWDNPDLENSEEAYLLARQFYERNGRKIIDATVEGSCSVFEKIDYKKYFKITGLNKSS